MVHVVNAANRLRFYRELDHMHCDRARVFGDCLEQIEPCLDSSPDIDQFDVVDTIYLLESDWRTRRHLASLRLLPTMQPHMQTSVYAHLCEFAPPSADDIWEASRCCVSPDVPSL